MVLLSQEEFRQWSMSRVNYERHRPETTLLYQIIQQHWPRFQAELGSQGKHLPNFVTQEFEAYLKCGRLEHGFIPGILPFTPSGPTFGCSNTFLTYLSSGTLRELQA